MPEIEVLNESHHAGILAIYNHYIETSACTFDTEAFELAARQPWFQQFKADPYKCFVATRNGVVEGYACAMMFRTKPAYATSAEVSVYTRADAQGKGTGSCLYQALMDHLDTTPLHRAYAGITLPNEASFALHRKYGFTEVAHYHEVGYKFDRYWDVVWLEREIASKGC